MIVSSPQYTQTFLSNGRRTPTIFGCLNVSIIDLSAVLNLIWCTRSPIDPTTREGSIGLGKVRRRSEALVFTYFFLVLFLSLRVLPIIFTRFLDFRGSSASCTYFLGSKIIVLWSSLMNTTLHPWSVENCSSEAVEFCSIFVVMLMLVPKYGCLPGWSGFSYI